MSEVFITYKITISEEELEIIEAILESQDDVLFPHDMEDAIIHGILEQILDQERFDTKEIK